jgi:hypothetical protein
VNEGDLNAARLASVNHRNRSAVNVVNSWGDAKLLDARLHSCHFDGDVMCGSRERASGMVQKYSHDGRKLLLQIGKKWRP